MITSSLPLNPCLRMERSWNGDNTVSCISTESSIHPSDYDSEDSSINECYGRERCAVTKSSPTSPLDETTKKQEPVLASSFHRPHSFEIMSSETSSSDGWKTDSSSASYLSSIGDNGSQYDEARTSLQCRQKMARSDESKVALVAVEQHTHSCSTNLGSLSRHHVLECMDDLSQVNSPSLGHHIVGLAKLSGRKALVQGNHRAMPENHSPRQELPLSRLRVHQDRVPTIEVHPLSSDSHPVHVAIQRMMGNDIEKANARDTDAQHRNKCESRRSDFEMFLILVITASSVTLVVLLALILKSRN